MNRNLGWLIVALSIVAMAPAEAAETPLPIGIDGELRLALENNAALKGQAAALEASRWHSRGSALAFLPSGAFTSSVTRVDDESLEQANQAQVGMTAMFEGLAQSGLPGMDQLGGIEIDPFLYRDTYRSSFTLNQEFPLNLHLIGGHKLALAGERSSRHAYEGGRESLILGVRQAYLGLLAAHELIRVAEEALAGAENRDLLAAEREELGLISRSDRLLWQVVAAQARRDLAAARSGLALAEMEMNRITGRPLGTSLAPAPLPDDFLSGAGKHGDRDLEALIEQALRGSPQARALDAVLDTAAAGKLLGLSGLTPSLHFAFNYGWRDNDTAALDDYRSWSATAMVNVPVFDLPSRLTGYREAAANARRAHYEVDDARDRLRMAMAAAWHGVKFAAESRLHMTAARDQAEETYALMRDRYELGHVSEFDLIDVQTATTAARAAEVSARYDYYGALAALESLLGEAGAGVIDEEE